MQICIQCYSVPFISSLSTQSYPIRLSDHTMTATVWGQDKTDILQLEVIWRSEVFVLYPSEKGPPVHTAPDAGEM